MSLRILFLAMALAVLGHTMARAVEPDEMLPDPGEEARARALTRELRCVVCQNQSVDDSDAPLAKDIRILVREQIAHGQSDVQVRNFIVQRYGKFVLLNPPLEADTALIWIGPFAVFFVALGIAFVYVRRAGSAVPGTPLSASEERDVAARIGEERP